MASQSGYRGRIGNVIHYEMNGKFYTRSAPKKFTQTDATKARAKEFGKASTIGSVIREEMDSIIFEPANRKMQTKLVKEVFSWLQVARDAGTSDEYQPKSLVGFDFSPESPGLKRRWKMNSPIIHSLPGQLQIIIPTLTPKKSFQAPAHTADVVCKIATVVIDVENKTELYSYTKDLIFPYNDMEVAGQTIIQELPPPNKFLILTGIAIEYLVIEYKNKKGTTDKMYQPSEIVHAMYI
jgi:hypothetical protein